MKKHRPLPTELRERIIRYLAEHLRLEPEADEVQYDLAESVEQNAAPLAEEPKRRKNKLTAFGGYSMREASQAPMQSMAMPDLAALVDRPAESFSSMLLRLIDERGMTDPQVYKRAGLDRKHFSKIRSNPSYRPSKNTALALAVALRLDLDRTADLLRRAGYALSPASRADLIVEYFIREGNWELDEINEALYAFDENLLGG